jgi:glycine hydroxymethyltransferase
VALERILTDDFLHYMVQVKKNAKEACCSILLLKDYNISGGTDNHMMLVDLKSKNITGKQAEEALGMAEITVNRTCCF